MGRFWDGHQLLIRIEDVEIFHAGRARFFVEQRNGADSAGKTGTEERVLVAGTRVSSVTGRSGERSGAVLSSRQDRKSLSRAKYNHT